MSKEWSKISWEEVEQDKCYNIWIDGVLEGKIYKIDHHKWMIDVYFDVSKTGVWGNIIYPPELSRKFNDRGEARSSLVKLWEEFKQDNIPEVEISIDQIEEDTDPDYSLPYGYNPFSNTP